MKKLLKIVILNLALSLFGISINYAQKPMATSDKVKAPRTYLVDDFNNDGYSDIITISRDMKNYIQNTGIYIRYNNKNGNFSKRENIVNIKKATYSDGIKLLSGDFNNDGNKDIYVIVVHKTGEQAQYYFQNDGKGKFINKTNFN